MTFNLDIDDIRAEITEAFKDQGIDLTGFEFATMSRNNVNPIVTGNRPLCGETLRAIAKKSTLVVTARQNAWMAGEYLKRWDTDGVSTTGKGKKKRSPSQSSGDGESEPSSAGESDRTRDTPPPLPPPLSYRPSSPQQLSPPRSRTPPARSADPVPPPPANPDPPRSENVTAAAPDQISSEQPAVGDQPAPPLPGEGPGTVDPAVPFIRQTRSRTGAAGPAAAARAVEESSKPKKKT